MFISDRVNIIRQMARDTGNYSVVAKNCGVSYHWLNKFATGSIKNPTVDNVDKLERYLAKAENDD